MNINTNNITLILSIRTFFDYPPAFKGENA